MGHLCADSVRKDFYYYSDKCMDIAEMWILYRSSDRVSPPYGLEKTNTKSF